MVEAHVYFRFKPEYQDAQSRNDFAERCKKLSQIPEVRDLRVGTPADARSEAAWDLCLILVVESAAAAATCAAHPAYKALLDSASTPQLAVTKDWNFAM